jgi:uncharacterized protein YceK
VQRYCGPGVESPVPPTPEAPRPRQQLRVRPWLLVALVVVLLVAGVAVVISRQDGGPGAEVGAGAAGTTTTTTSTGAGASSPAPPTTAPDSQVPPAQRRLFDELMAQTAEIRGLAWKDPLNLKVVSREELARRVVEVNARDTDPARTAAKEATLKLLDLIPEEVDYDKLIEDVLAGAVVGFYDPKTRELFVGSGEELDGQVRATIVHEMVHALTDQHFNYGPKVLALDEADRAEESLAYSALLEGDARLVESIWMERHLDPLEALAAALGLGAGGDGGEALANAPPYVVKSLLFPYTEGVTFVESLHSAGGFAAVDGAYRRPPTSSEHILHPSTYSQSQGAAAPPLPDVAAATGCQRVRAGALGEFDMREVLGAHVGVSDAGRAAQGWNGDTYTLVRCGGVLGLADRWETDPGVDAARLTDALGRWARGWSGGRLGGDGRFSGPAGAGRITRAGNRVELVVAGNADTADRLVRALG